MKRIILAVIIIMLTTQSAYASVTLTKQEQYFYNQINKERKAVNSQPLKINEKLTLYARVYAKEMHDNNFLDHVSPITGDLYTRIDKAGIENWTMVGENIGIGMKGYVIHAELMNSPTHKRNMLFPTFNCVGVGVYGDKGVWYVVEELARVN